MIEITKGKRYAFQTFSGQTLRVLVTSEPNYLTYDGPNGKQHWVGFFAYRVKANKDGSWSTFGTEHSYTVRRVTLVSL